MLKNIQKYLLLNHPLIWNTKLFPMTIVLLIINLLFFALGFYNGKIDFTETNINYSYNSNEPLIVFVGVLLTMIIVIIWLVSYFKNNAFKSFYPKQKSSLFKEWLIIFLIIFMTAMFSLSYLYAKEVRVRNYFSRQEAEKRCETLSLGSIFLDGSFGVKYYKEINKYGDTIQVQYKYATFKNKKYETNSLINKNIENFQFFKPQKQLSIKEKTQNWLFNENKTAIKSMMKDYLAIANEHHLMSNINENQWFDLVYNAPKFTEINIIGKAKMINDYEHYNNYAEKAVADAAASAAMTVSKYDDFDYVNKFKIRKNGFDEEYFKHYVPAANLNYAYEKIADAWISPDIIIEKMLFPLYFAFGFSLLIFSFRITSGRNWFIALISLGIINIILGIFSAMFSTEKIYILLLFLLVIGLFIYFIFILNRKTEKSISAITLNCLLWLYGAFIPIAYYLFVVLLKWKYEYAYIDYSGLSHENQQIYNFIELLQNDNSRMMLITLNLLFMFIFMYFITIKIKKWKGIPEN